MRARPARERASRQPDLTSRERSFPDSGVECHLETKIGVQVGGPVLVLAVHVERGGGGAGRLEPGQRLRHQPPGQPAPAVGGQRPHRADEADGLRAKVNLVLLDLAESDGGRLAGAVAGHQLEFGPPTPQELVVIVDRHRRFDPSEGRVLRVAPQHQRYAAHACCVFLDARACLPVEARQDALHESPVGRRVAPPRQHLALPQAHHRGQVLDVTWPHVVARATTSRTSGTASRIRASRSVSTWCACSSETSPASAATTCAYICPSRSLSSTSTPLRTSGCDSTTSLIRAVSWARRSVTSWPATTVGSSGSRWMSMRDASGSSSRSLRSNCALASAAFARLMSPRSLACMLKCSEPSLSRSTVTLCRSRMPPSRAAVAWMRSTRSLDRAWPSTSTVSSSLGTAARATRLISSIIAPAASTESMRRVATLASPSRFGPLRRTRTERTSRTPLTRRIASRSFVSAPAGARSMRMSPERQISITAARAMMTATSSAAAESAHAKPARTPASPASTPSVEITSDSRFVASACSASLSASLPTRRSTPARPASTTSVAIRRTNAYHAGSTTAPSPVSRLSASNAIPTAVITSSTPSANAARFSARPCP